MKQAIIYIFDRFHCDYAVIDEEQIETHYRVPLEELSILSHTIRSTILLPGGDILLADVKVPKTSRSKLLKAVPFALEDKLIDDVEALHFVLGRHDAKGILSTAVIQRSVMQDWVQFLKSHNIYSDTMLPIELALPYTDNQWHILIANEQAQVRTGKNAGFSVELSHFSTFIHLQAAEGLKPEKIFIDYTEDHKDYHNQHLDDLDIEIEYAEQACDPLQLFAAGIQQKSDINLLQPPYSLNIKRQRTGKLWHWAAYVVIAMCAVWLATQITQWSILDKRVNKTTAQINKLYYDVFPGNEGVVSPKFRIKKALESNQNLASGGKFLGDLTIVGQQLKLRDGRVTIDAIEYQNGGFTISVTGPSFNDLNKFVTGLAQQQLNASLTNARTEGKVVKAQVKIGVMQ
tara:strand:+ start:73834 stop:75039 length:1206 start_codon:yes stop_codon:yes gene_type:complete